MEGTNPAPKNLLRLRQPYSELVSACRSTEKLNPMFERLLPSGHSLWIHRELLLQFTMRSVELRHKGSHLGLVWSIINPLMMLGLYVFVFGFIFEGSFGVTPNETKLEYGLGIFLGLSVFHLFAECIAMAPTTIRENPNFVKKVVFPLEILPASLVGTGAFHLMISLGIIGVIMIATGNVPDRSILLLPVVLVPVLLMCMGLSWLVAALGVFFRDISQLTSFLNMALLFSSAVFYPARDIPAPAWAVLKFNPVLQTIEQIRNIALWNLPLEINSVCYLWATSLVSVVIGYTVFDKLKPAFADVI